MTQFGPHGYPRTKRYAAEAAPASSGSKVYVALAILVLAGGAVVGGWLLSGRHAGSSSMLGDDSVVQRMIDTTGLAEARDWLNSRDDRMVMGMNRPQAIALTERLYKMGAKGVMVPNAGIGTMTLVVELPQDAGQRKALFDWQDQWYHQIMEPPAKDVGQKYLAVKMHI